MSLSLPTGELRRAVSLFATEWWVFVGGVVGYLVYGCWVVATGFAFTTADSLSRPELLALSVVVWLLVPAAVAAWLLIRRLSNEHGNLRERYRLDHPSALLWPPGVVMLGCLGATLTVGRSPTISLVALAASVFLLVRTLAYGFRVYTLSVPRLFSLLALLSGVALSAGWLAHATMLAGVNASASDAVTRAGVDSFVEAGTAAVGTSPAAALPTLVGVPAMLSTAYLLIQSVAGAVIRRRAPFANPVRRPGQRFPVMSPVPESQGNRDAESADSEAVETSHSSGETEPPESLTGGETTQTRVFTPGDDPPAERETRTVQTDTAESTDGWDDDTSVFSPEHAGCENCGRAVPEAASVCPNCGQRVGE